MNAKEYAEPEFAKGAGDDDEVFAKFPTGEPWTIPCLTVADVKAFPVKKTSGPRIKVVGTGSGKAAGRGRGNPAGRGRGNTTAQAQPKAKRSKSWSGSRSEEEFLKKKAKLAEKETGA